MIKAVLVDVDNTLLDFNTCANYSIKSAAQEISLPLTDNIFEVFHEINEKLWLDIECGRLTNDEFCRVRWNMIFERLGITGDGMHFEKLFRKYLALSAQTVFGAKELMEYLDSRYIVCIASNGSYEQQRRRLEFAGLLKYVKKVFTSECAGYSKPHKAFFEKCILELYPIKPHEIMMIGDSITADILGAHLCGIKTCWYNKNHISDMKCDYADYIVGALNEIREIL